MHHYKYKCNKMIDNAIIILHLQKNIICKTGIN